MLEGFFLEAQTMPTFPARSLANFATLHGDLQRVCEEAIKIVDFSIVCGFRDKASQDNAFKAGTSKVQWPNSKHNVAPSHAMDLAPYPIDWNDRERFVFLAGVITACAVRIGVNLRWGGDFNGNGKFSDDKFSDLPHFELVS